MAKASEFAIAKFTPPGGNALEYPNHDRANEIYSQYISGFTEDEIASFHGLDIEEVKKDIMYTQTRIPVKQIISQNNDRNRILVQREQSESFRRLIGESLALPAQSFLTAGVSPTGVLKEFREATGMIAKAEPLIQVNTQQNFLGGGASGQNGISSAEDVIRKVLDQINQNDLQDEPPPPEEEVLEAELVSSEERVPGEDEVE
jgi:hypothetical protein